MSLEDVETIELDMTGLFRELEDAIQDAITAGDADTLALLGVTGQPSQEALAFATERAAELVGMSFEGGKLVPNPNAKFAITDTIRNQVRDMVTVAVDEGKSPQKLTSELSGLFDSSRAETIARTETGLAYNHAVETRYTEEGRDLVEVVDGDGCLPGGHDDRAPRAQRVIGEVQETNQADGQVWPVSAISQFPLGHPNCVRAFIPFEGAA